MADRTVDEAEAIITEEGAASWVGLTDPELLGCEPAEHEEWLRTAPEAELRGWARSVAADWTDDEVAR